MADFLLAPRRVASIELAALLSVFLASTWWLAPLTHSRGWALVFLAMVLITLIHITVISPRLYQAVGPANSLAAMPGRRYYLLATVIGCAALFVLGRFISTVPEGLSVADVSWKFARYLGFAAVQVYVYFVFIRPRLILVLGTRPRPILVAALLACIFAIVHAPNPYLVMATPVAAFVWALLYARFPNFVFLTLSHALLGTSVQIFTDWSTRIGPAFTNPDHYALRSALKFLLPATN